MNRKCKDVQITDYFFKYRTDNRLLNVRMDANHFAKGLQDVIISLEVLVAAMKSWKLTAFLFVKQKKKKKRKKDEDFTRK